MLELIEIQRPEDKLSYLNEFDVHNQTWLVSDLRTKFEIQSRLFEKVEILEEDAILRASEFWRKFLVRNFPDLNLVSADVARTLLGLWLRENESEEKWLHSPGAAESLFAHMQQLLPLIVQTGLRQEVEDWFEQNPEASLRWKTWWELSTQYLGEFLKVGLFPSSWGQALLVDRDLAAHWSRDLVVDLNIEMTPLEAEVIWQIAQTTNVKVFVPSPDWIGSFEMAYQGYFHLFDRLGKERPQFKDLEFPIKPEIHQTLRLSSQAAEVKQAVAQEIGRAHV